MGLPEKPQSNMKIVESFFSSFLCGALGKGNVKFATWKLLRASFYHFFVVHWREAMSNLQRENYLELAELGIWTPMLRCGSLSWGYGLPCFGVAS